jgi:predicted Zn-dependent peptidase
MIKRLFTIFLIVQGVLMSAVLEHVEIRDVKVPIIFEKDRNLPIASMQLIFKNSGSLADKKNGLAKLSAKLLNEGTKSDGAVEFSKKLEDRAIDLSVNSGDETFVIELNSLRSEFDYGVKLLEKLLNDPNYTRDTMSKIKTQTLGELKRKESDFDYISYLKLKGLLFPNTPLAKPSLGTVESVNKITLNDIKEFIDTHLGVENAILVIGGDMNISEAKTIAKNILNRLPHVESRDIPRYKAKDDQKVEITKVDTKQAYIYFGSPLNIECNSSKRYLAKVASFILGSGGFGSRIMEEIRVKRGLAYSAYGRFAINRTSSYFWGYLQTKVASQDEAVNSIKETIDEFVKKGATTEELESAKQFLLGSEPLRNETLSQRLHIAFMEYYHNRPFGANKKDLELIDKMSLNELNSFIFSIKEIEKLSFSIVTK